jgi:hypothetical protein
MTQKENQSSEPKKHKNAGQKPPRMIPLTEGHKPQAMTPVQPAKPATPAPTPAPKPTEPPKK